MAREWAEEQVRERKFTVKLSDAGACKRVLSIEVSPEELAHAEAAILAELRTDLKVPGFRKGKVPAKYIEKNYKDVIRADAVRNLLPAVYEDALVRTGIHPVGEPKFENVKTGTGDAIAFDVTVEVRPEVEIQGYRGVKVTVKKTAIDDSTLNHALEHLRESLATYRVVDRKIRDGDFVLIDYGPLLSPGVVDKKRLAVNYPVDLSRETLLKEFREGLTGMETGEEKDILVQYPDDFPDKESAGTSKTFHVRVKEIKEKVLPELNDDLAKRVDEKLTNLEGLKARIREDLEKDEEKRIDHDAEEQIIDKLIAKNPFDVPEAMIHNYIHSLLEEDRKRRPVVADEAAREQELMDHFRDAAVRTIKKFFVMEAVRKQEAIEVADDEVDGKIDQLATGGRAKPEEVRAFFRNPERRRGLENELRDRKILDFLRRSADVKVA
jgi:trigger factor